MVKPGASLELNYYSRVYKAWRQMYTMPATSAGFRAQVAGYFVWVAFSNKILLATFSHEPLLIWL